MKTKRLTVRFSKEDDAFMDRIIEDGKAKNRAEVVIMALELEMKKSKLNGFFT